MLRCVLLDSLLEDYGAMMLLAVSPRRFLFQLSTLLLILCCGQTARSESNWQVGIATAKITPEKPVWMAGYAGRKGPSEGVVGDLFAKAMVIQDDQGQRIVIVTTDLISIPRQLREELEVEIKEKFQLDRQNLWLNASHTHCGPELRLDRIPPTEGSPADFEKRIQLALEYTSKLYAQLLDIIGQSLKDLKPGKLNYLHARCGFAMNRRRPTAQGVINAPHSDGPVNHDVPVLQITDLDGKLRALLFSYACHNTTMGFNQISGDYAGFAQKHIEAAHEGVTAMFFTGCGGDQNPYPRGKVEYLDFHGRALANAVEAALQTVPKPVNGPLRLKYDTVKLNFGPTPPLAELEKLAMGTAEPVSSHARRLLQELKETGKIRSTYDYPVQVIQFGQDWTVIALAGEVVVDYSLRLTRELAPANVAVAGYSNDVFGYVPSLRVLQEGGYEAGGAMLWGPLPGPFAADVEDNIIGKVKELLETTPAK
ncbi:MAG: neutral/alkaline non-lysosomal ceramidase N-terminal domain-containing protein [Planctomycetota bacterium]